METLEPRGSGRRKFHEAKQEGLVEIEFKRTVGLWDVENIRRGVKNHWSKNQSCSLPLDSPYLFRNSPLRDSKCQDSGSQSKHETT